MSHCTDWRSLFIQHLAPRWFCRLLRHYRNKCAALTPQRFKSLIFHEDDDCEYNIEGRNDTPCMLPVVRGARRIFLQRGATYDSLPLPSPPLLLPPLPSLLFALPSLLEVGYRS